MFRRLNVTTVSFLYRIFWIEIIRNRTQIIWFPIHWNSVNVHFLDCPIMCIVLITDTCINRTEGVTSLHLSILQLPSRWEISNTCIWFQNTQLIASCDSFNQNIYYGLWLPLLRPLITFITAFDYLHYGLWLPLLRPLITFITAFDPFGVFKLFLLFFLIINYVF